MAFNILTLLRLRSGSKLTHPTKTHTRSPHQLFKPTPLSMPQNPGSQILPCGCSRSHVLIQNLDTVVENPYPGRSSAFSSTSTATTTSTSSPASLHRQDTDFEDSGCQFQYYLPHISNSVTDFYTDQEWVAYDIRDGNEEAETEILITEDLELQFIHDDDFQYYPTSEMGTKSVISNATEISPTMGTSLKRTKLMKKKVWEEFWLEKVVLRVLAKMRLRAK